MQQYARFWALEFWFTSHWKHMDGLVQERRNSSANALELRLSCSNTLICWRAELALLRGRKGREQPGTRIGILLILQLHNHVCIQPACISEDLSQDRSILLYQLPIFNTRRDHSISSYPTLGYITQIVLRQITRACFNDIYGQRCILVI